MNQTKIYSTVFAFFSFYLLSCHAKNFVQSQTLSLISIIELPGIKGRIDHIAFNPGLQQVFIAALGNNSVEVIDLKAKKVVYSIHNLSEPQGIIFVRETNTIFVSNGKNGRCDVFNAHDFSKITSIQLEGDADNVRYDSTSKKIFVGYGNGGIAIIDAYTYKVVGNVKLEGHPESFQLDGPGKRIFVNVPDKEEVEIIDLNKKKVIKRWKLRGAKLNFPMGLDTLNHHLFIGSRHQDNLLVLDTESGSQVTTLDTDSDADDLFYDQKNDNIYLSCGSGFIDVFKQKIDGNYKFIEKISSASGARTSLFIPNLNELIVASPKNSTRNASLLVFEIKK